MQIQEQAWQAALSHGGCICLKPVCHTGCQCRYCGKPSLPSTATFGTNLLMSHCSVGQPRALPGRQATSRLSAEPASHRNCRCPGEKATHPLLPLPSTHTHPGAAAVQGKQRDTQPLLPFWLFLYEDLYLCQEKAVGENHSAVPAAMSGVFNSEPRQRCTGKNLRSLLLAGDCIHLPRYLSKDLHGQHKQGRDFCHMQHTVRGWQDRFCCFLPLRG